MLWATSPACTELETHVLDWLADLLALPATFRSSGSGGGVIQDSASASTLCAVVAVRERATEYVSNQRGCDGTLVAYASSQAHSSVENIIAGIGSDRLRQSKWTRAMPCGPEALEQAVLATGPPVCGLSWSWLRLGRPLRMPSIPFPRSE